MAQFVVRNLETHIRDRLRELARRHGRSMEAEVRDILRRAAASSESESGLGSRITRRFARIGLTADIAELRGRPARAARFDK